MNPGGIRTISFHCCLVYRTHVITCYYYFWLQLFVDSILWAFCKHNFARWCWKLKPTSFFLLSQHEHSPLHKEQRNDKIYRGRNMRTARFIKFDYREPICFFLIVFVRIFDSWNEFSWRLNLFHEGGVRFIDDFQTLSLGLRISRAKSSNCVCVYSDHLTSASQLIRYLVAHL